MRFKNLIYASAFSTLMLAAGACKKGKFDINSNPDDITDVSVSPSVILPAALQSTSRLVAADWNWLSMWMGHWARNGSYQPQTDIETYSFTNEFQVRVWNDLYANTTNYNIMQKKAAETGAGFYEAIARIMKAHNFQLLVDIYNNVPYSEAFRGTALATPKYDKGIDIYKDLFRQLDTALTLLKTASAIEEAKNPDIATSDLVYHGDTESWMKFANTLKLRMIVHLHNGIAANQTVQEIDIAAELAKISPEGFIGEGESAHLNPGFVSTKPNPYYREYVQTESGSQSNDIIRASEYAIEYYKGNSDPRIGRFYVAPSTGHLGNRLGNPSSTDANGFNPYSGDRLSTVRGPGLLPAGAASRAWILTSVESLFLQAEAAHRGILTGVNAKDLLISAVSESFVWLGLTSAQSATYLAANAGWPDVDYDAPSRIAGQPGGGLYTILSQKWFALNSLAPYEVWTDYRRTDFVLGAAVSYTPGPPISIAPGTTATTIPRRLLYPQNEYNYNASNVGKEGAINIFSSKVFWDLN